MWCTTRHGCMHTYVQLETDRLELADRLTKVGRRRELRLHHGAAANNNKEGRPVKPLPAGDAAAANDKNKEADGGVIVVDSRGEKKEEGGHGSHEEDGHHGGDKKKKDEEEHVTVHISSLSPTNVKFYILHNMDVYVLSSK